MSYPLLFGLVLLLLLLFVWSLWRHGKAKATPDVLSEMEDCGPRNITFLPQIQQTFSSADLEYLASRGSVKLARRVRKERRRAALLYVAALQNDFQWLLRLARAIAVLSPEVGAADEFERLQLSVRFAWRYQLLRTMLVLQLAPMPQLSVLSGLVSGFAVRMQEAMNELGERAALAAELASSLERRGAKLS